MEPTAPTFSRKVRVGSKRSLDSSGELPLVKNKLSRLEYASTSSRLDQLPHLDESAGTSSNKFIAINTLPEYVLCHLFSYLRTQDLYNLSKCDPKFYKVLRSEKKLWKNVIDACNGSSPCHSRLQPFLNNFTTILHLLKSINISWSASPQSHIDECLELSFFESLKSLPNLRSFIVENHSLDYKMLNTTFLPECVTELRLRGINLLNQNERRCATFQDLHLNLPNLEVLDVSYCLWVIPQMLCSFAQCSHLKKLIMVGCRGIDNIIPYAVHATDFGFLELETLDLRLTSYVSLNDIAVFKKLKNLKHIYLENAKRCRQDRPCNKATRMPMPACRRFRTKSRRLSNYINNWLETLVVRNYSSITDKILSEIEESFESINYLDVTGTKCTAERVASFQIRCPQIKILRERVIENADLQSNLDS